MVWCRPPPSVLTTSLHGTNDWTGFEARDAMRESADESQEFEIEPLVGLNVGRFAPLTFPAYREFLIHEIKNPSPDVYALGASRHHQPAGLLLAGDLEALGPTIRSIYVVPDCRRLGIGAQLLWRAEKEARARNWSSLRGAFMEGPDALEGLRGLLAHSGWREPDLRTRLYKLSRRKIKEARWLRRRRPLPADFEYFRWTELRPEERAKLIRVHQDTGWPKRDVFPFRYGEQFDEESSFGLRFQGDVVGWAVNHKLSSDTIRFTCSYLREDLQTLGRLVEVYAQSIDRILRHTHYDYAVFTVPVEYPAMIRFAERHLAPYAVGTKRSFGSVKAM